MFRINFVMLPILALLVACVEPAPLPTPPDADSCGATALQDLVGRPLRSEAGEQRFQRSSHNLLG